LPSTQPHPLDTIAETVRAETVVTKSRFITTLAPATDRDEADEVVASVRREFHDAGHHCTAMVFGLDGARERSNDDGEPAGTAGAPMLAVLRGADLTEVVAVVTRYFGGTLLGAGGLVRAYGGAVSAAVAAADRVTRRPVALFDLHASHEDAGRLEHRLRTWAEATTGVPSDAISPGEYNAEGARYAIAVPLDHIASLRSELASSDVVHHLEECGHQIRPVPGGQRMR
jgi:uncharacterized YigZ family protein